MLEEIARNFLDHMRTLCTCIKKTNSNDYKSWKKNHTKLAFG